jgi:hypothetical protein
MTPNPDGHLASESSMSTFAFIMLSFLTGFTYYFYWCISLGYNVNGSGRFTTRVNTKLLIATAALLAWSYVIPFFVYVGGAAVAREYGSFDSDAVISAFMTADGLQSFLSFAFAVFNAFAFVKFAFRLREYFQNSGINAGCSGIAAFFFSGFYIYYAVRRANAVMGTQTSPMGYTQHPLVNPPHGYPQSFGQPASQQGVHQPPQQGFQQPQQGYQQPQQGYQQPQQGYQQPQQGYQQPQQGFQQPQQGFQQPQQGFQQPQGQPGQPGQPGAGVDVSKKPDDNR